MWLRSAKPSSAAFPVSPDVATSTRNSSVGTPEAMRRSIASEKKTGMHCSAMSLNAEVGPCQSSSTCMPGATSRIGATASVSKFEPYATRISSSTRSPGTSTPKRRYRCAARLR